ncbi:hypothetical protein AMECASPLE_034496 [Ameca splendens]|uniref:Uncharacterized protein n=1 Tax=Ameca splendens TaxID=208324 RepID=A0ABV0Y706_9TELE
MEESSREYREGRSLNTMRQDLASKPEEPVRRNEKQLWHGERRAAEGGRLRTRTQQKQKYKKTQGEKINRDLTSNNSTQIKNTKTQNNEQTPNKAVHREVNLEKQDLKNTINCKEMVKIHTQQKMKTQTPQDHYSKRMNFEKLIIYLFIYILK